MFINIFIASLISITCFQLSAAFQSQLETTIRSSNGTDITSSFQTMVYWVPRPEKIVATPDLTGRQSNPAVQYLNHCASSTARFVGSHCQHKSGVTGAIQEYVIYCQEPPQPGGPYRSGYTTNSHPSQRLAERGVCHSDEVCMPGSRGLLDGVRIYTAVCVKKSVFRSYRDEQVGNTKNSLLENGTASVVLSAQDGRTPLEAQSMGISAAEANGVTVQEQNCTDCIEIRTPPLLKNAEALEVQAWLEDEKLRTLQVAGVLYVILNLFAG